MSTGYDAITFSLFPLKRTVINKHTYHETPGKVLIHDYHPRPSANTVMYTQAPVC